MYQDDYESCNTTYTTLRIYSESLSPQDITEYLEIEPSEIIDKCIVNGISMDEDITLNAWFLTSKNVISSKDSRRHIDYIADRLLPINEKIKTLAKQDVKIDICCFWMSESGQGGPTLSPQQLSKLAELELEIWFDIY